MGQLIDKTVLRKELSKLQSEMGFVRKSDVMQILGSQKCAYNIESIVKQLGDYGNGEMDYYRNTPYEKCIEECVHKAIEIVKGGGANYETQLDGLKEKTEEDREV